MLVPKVLRNDAPAPKLTIEKDKRSTHQNSAVQKLMVMYPPMASRVPPKLTRKGPNRSSKYLLTTDTKLEKKKKKKEHKG
jgi:hypothetical protein